jgi:signal transduction histidine kinase
MARGPICGMSISPELFGDLLGGAPVMMPRPAASLPIAPHAFSELLASSHLVHTAAREHLGLLLDALDAGPRCVVAASETGIVLHARSDGTIDGQRAPGARLFSEAEETVLRGGGVIVFEDPAGNDCEMVVPFFVAEMFSGALGLRMPARLVTRPIIAALLQTARTIGAVVDLQTTRSHHEQAVATIGHELRQPLSALVTALDLLQRMGQGVPLGPLRAAQRQALQLCNWRASWTPCSMRRACSAVVCGCRVA